MQFSFKFYKKYSLYKYKVIIFQFLVKQSLSVWLTDQCDHTFDNPLASYLISDSHYYCKSGYERVGEIYTNYAECLKPRQIPHMYGKKLKKLYRVVKHTSMYSIQQPHILLDHRKRELNHQCRKPLLQYMYYHTFARRQHHPHNKV